MVIPGGGTFWIIFIIFSWKTDKMSIFLYFQKVDILSIIAKAQTQKLASN